MPYSAPRSDSRIVFHPLRIHDEGAGAVARTAVSTASFRNLPAKAAAAPRPTRVRMRYHDFDLSIEEGADSTLVLRSSCDPHGEYTEVVALDAATMAQDREMLTRDDVARDRLMAFGRRLYGLTFGAGKHSLEWHFGLCWGAAGSGDTGVRLRLRVKSPALAVVPWELIYSDRLNCYFGVSERTPIVRYLELPQRIPSLEAELPLRILVVIPEQPELATEAEEAALRDALETLDGVVELTVLRGRISRRDMADTLEERQYHVLHFIGHGDFTDDKAILVLKDHDGGDEYVEAERVAGLFRNHPSMKLIVLNSCRGGSSSATKPLVGMAAELVRAGIPSVIAMQEAIVDAEAVCFARAFYRALFLNRDKGRVDIAISHARNALAEDFPDTRAIGLPVLFTHAREGVLFSLEQGSPLRDLSVRSADRVKAIIRTHEQNLEFIRAAPADADADTTAASPPTAGAPSRSVTRGVSAAEIAESQALARARQRLRFRNWSLALAVAIALVVSFGATWFGVQIRWPVFRPDSYVVAFTELFDHHENEASVLLVATDSVAEAGMGPQNAGRRGIMSRVLDRLVAGGAPVIAINLDFLASPAFAAQTDSLKAALEHAAAHGTVVLAAAPVPSASVAMEPALAPLLRLGTNCADTSSAVTAPVMTLMSERGASGPRTYSLPLAAVAAFTVATPRTGNATERVPASDEATRQLLQRVALDSPIASHADIACRFDGGDRLYRMAIDFAPQHAHVEHVNHVSFRQAMDTTSLGDLRYRLVLVGYWTDQRSFPLLRGWHREVRSNIEVEEDAMNTLLRGIRIAPIGLGSQYLVILVMAGLGALAAYLRVPFGRSVSFATLVLALVLYFVAGAALYASRHALLNTTFDIPALLLAFLAVSLTRRVWFP